MPAGTLNLSIEQGTTYTNAMTVTVDSNTDISTFTFSSDIKTEKLSDHTIASFTITKTDQANGAFSISLTSDQTANIPAGDYVWDLAYVDSTDSSRVRLLQGNVTISGEVTRA